MLYTSKPQNSFLFFLIDTQSCATEKNIWMTSRKFFNTAIGQAISLFRRSSMVDRSLLWCRSIYIYFTFTADNSIFFQDCFPDKCLKNQVFDDYISLYNICFYNSFEIFYVNLRGFQGSKFLGKPKARRNDVKWFETKTDPLSPRFFPYMRAKIFTIRGNMFLGHFPLKV